MVASLLDTVIDTPAPRRLAEFYRRLLDLRYRPGDEPSGGPDADWLVLVHPDGRRALAFQQVAELRRCTWPDPDVPQQLHLDCTVADSAQLRATVAEAVAMGATVLHDRSDHPDEPLFVLADPDGHPFCAFVSHVS
ncbi:MAG TPA: VOC family protein [Acidimicrobiales bacterium]|nr:VOC family protein [Acidimicrobiales bacterium]